MKENIKFEYFENENPEPEKDKKDYYEHTQVTDRSLQEYQEYLNLPLESLQGKIVLDIGSGQKESFAKQAKKMGINVVFMSPDLKDEEVRDRLKGGFFKKLKWTGKSVAGIVQELPFGDSVFDAEVSLFAFPFHLPKSETELKRGFQEILRTLKPGGRAYIYPIKGDLLEAPMFKKFYKNYWRHQNLQQN